MCAREDWRRFVGLFRDSATCRRVTRFATKVARVVHWLPPGACLAKAEDDPKLKTLQKASIHAGGILAFLVSKPHKGQKSAYLGTILLFLSFLPLCRKLLSFFARFCRSPLSQARGSAARDWIKD